MVMSLLGDEHVDIDPIDPFYHFCRGAKRPANDTVPEIEHKTSVHSDDIGHG